MARPTGIDNSTSTSTRLLAPVQVLPSDLRSRAGPLQVTCATLHIAQVLLVPPLLQTPKPPSDLCHRTRPDTARSTASTQTPPTTTPVQAQTPTYLLPSAVALVPSPRRPCRPDPLQHFTAAQSRTPARPLALEDKALSLMKAFPPPSTPSPRVRPRELSYGPAAIPWTPHSVNLP